MSGSRVRGERREYWSERVREWEDSGLTKKAFCLEHGLPLYSFYEWSRRLRPRESAAAEPGFARVHCGGDAGLRLRLGRRVVLELESDFDPKTLRRFLAAVEGPAEC